MLVLLVKKQVRSVSCKGGLVVDLELEECQD